MSEVDKHADVYFLPAIEHPTQEQLSYFLARAAFYDEIFEAGGMDADEAALNRSLALGRIGMGRVTEHHT